MRMREGCILLINIKYSFVIEEKEKENLSKKKAKKCGCDNGKISYRLRAGLSL